jgi:hypothetical protein
MKFHYGDWVIVTDDKSFWYKSVGKVLSVHPYDLTQRMEYLVKIDSDCSMFFDETLIEGISFDGKEES